ncbi:DNA-binding protein [Rhizorhabdus dicambivorans]|uniref:DNA-binding protein n=1 Tax=Rhizorhabdus dicambivorans TaxID=1850238 RepID=A0A2A4FSI2_9SPHN|nr:DNA-binding protein [Rhizorhabdus dicambivorans]PCE41147.1 DNA-binding protein [Rhizorhabdus dicambivorans]
MARGADLPKAYSAAPRRPPRGRITSENSIAGARGSTIEPLTVRIPMAIQLTGLSRSRLYRLIQSGEIKVIKIGRSTLISFESLKKLVER